MPLGKISQRQIEQAYKVLRDLQEIINEGGNESQLIDGSNKFYTLIPHSFGVDIPPVINTEAMIEVCSI